MKMPKNLGEDEYAALRNQMVTEQIVARGVSNERVLEVMRQVPRHLFVPEKLRQHAYKDAPLSIGKGQTISQPFIVALMTEILHIEPPHKVLEIGTGSGYQTAVLAELVDKVYTIEIITELSQAAEEIFKPLNYTNINIRNSDGYYGWPDAAPFDGIIVTAAPERVPQPLLEQLAEGGRMVIPVGDGMQFLEVYKRENDKIIKETNIPVRFVPMTGQAKKGNDDL